MYYYYFMNIKPKELSKLGYTNNIARSLAIDSIKKYCKHSSKEEVIETLKDLLEHPENYKFSEAWGKLAEHLSPTLKESKSQYYDLLDENIPYKTFGTKYIDTATKQQMNRAMRLPITVGGALMPDAHVGYGLPIGGVLATKDAVIPYAVGLDIGCRMSLSILDVNADFLKRYAHQLKMALKNYTHFGLDGGLAFKQEHEVLERNEFQTTDLLRKLHGKAVRQLASSGSGNHFVEFGEIEVFENNQFNLPSGNYVALLSHSGSRGLGASIAKYYSDLAQELCKLPREVQALAWFDLNSEEGQEYWMSMNLAGDYARACHEQIHLNLTKALGVKVLANVNNHHNFAWKELLHGEEVIVHRKGATPAQKDVPGFIPGSMATAGYLVRGLGHQDALNSASHGAGRVFSRSKAKNEFTVSAMKKYLSEKQVTLIGGSVEEMPLVYKDIEQVIRAQKDLVIVEGRFMPRIVRMNKD